MSACLSPEDIERYARKELTPKQRDLADLHLETCDRCVEALLEIELAGADAAPAAPEAATRPGPRIGPYNCIRELGRGGQGHVYLAEDSRLGRLVALKVLSPHLAPSPEVRLRFQREAAALSRLDHPNLCTVYEVGEADGAAYIAMRYIEGETLARRIAAAAQARQQGQGATREEVLGLALLIERCARALHAAHEAGLVHRDVKPGNIVVGRDGEPVLLDFGLVGEEEGLHTLTRTGELMGTPAYMSPEQVRGDRATVDRRSDVYSLGATLYEALTLRLPFDAPTVPAVCRQILTESAPDPRRHNRHITLDLKAILETAMEPDRLRRYRTALDFAADLHRFQAGETVLARPAGPIVKLRRWTRRNRAAAIAGLVVILSLSVALGLTLAVLRKAERDRDDKAAALVREEAVRLALHSASVLPTNPGQALLLAVESAGRRPTAAGNNALLAALDGCHERWRLFGHKSEIDDVDFSPDGRRVVTASRGGSARIWNAENGEPLQLLEGHNRSLVSARFSPDGSRVLTAGLDAAARLWDAGSGRELRAFRGHTRGLLLASFSPDGARILTVGQTTARVWDASTGTSLATLEPGAGGVITCAAFGPGGERVVTGTGDGAAIVWDARTGARVLALVGHGQAVTQATFSSDGARVLTSSKDGTARTWDAASGAQLVELKGHQVEVASAVFGPNGQWIATGSHDGKVRLWHAATGEELQRHDEHSEKVVRVAISGDGSRVLSLSADGTACVWEAMSGRTLAILRGHSGPLACGAFSPDGLQVVTGSLDHTARVWAIVPPGRPRAIREPMITSPIGLNLSPDGKRVVAGTRVVEVSVWDAGTGAESARLVGHKDNVFGIAFSPDGSTVATASGDGTARLWDPSTGAQLRVLAGHEAAVYAITFSPGGDRILSGSRDGTARLWDAATGAAIHVLRGHQSPVEAIAISPDGRLAATGSQRERVRLWSLERGVQLHILGDDQSTARDIDWSPDGKLLLTVGQHSASLWEMPAGKLRSTHNLWRSRAGAAGFCPDGKLAYLASETTRALVLDTASGQVAASLVHPGICSCAAWSADGKLLVTGGDDGKLRLWSTASWELLMESQQDGPITLVRLSRDGRTALTREGDGARVWQLQPVEQARRFLPGQLTPDERDRFEVGSPAERAAFRRSWQGGEIFGEAAR